MVKYLFLFFIPLQSMGWGFFAHKEINRLAVFTLPPEMIGFYKKNLESIKELAVNPDKRRYVLKEEACRHYIDLEFYRNYTDSIPHNWKKAMEIYPEDSLLRHGVVPWHINTLRYQLTKAFKEADEKRIIKISADLGHYIADANVPLHTTCNYNGQLTNQHGIHGLWESRLPELYFESYTFWVGKASYINNIQELCWKAVLTANTAVDSVLIFEKELSMHLDEDRKYSFEERGNATVKVYSREYSGMYHSMLAGQVERQMQKAVKMIGDIWFTCWTDAGRPDLSNLKITEDILEVIPSGTLGEDCKH